ncbi:MAG TPA: RNase P subunit p30 family protein [Candidatus Nanoarchaeia archaeon]|nr:RNase P subunit p30 family protein [Candidatus Nanoarchaeia archaeon]
MDYDIVIPQNNEQEFIKIASRLRIKKLVFLYDFETYLEKDFSDGKISIEIGFLANIKNAETAMKKSKFVAVKSSERDREFLEGKKTNIIYGFEEFRKKDFLHQRASGLNHITCEIAAKNGVTVGFSYGSLLIKEPREQSLTLGRMIQNMRLCKKYKTKTKIACFSSNPYHLRADYEIKSLLNVLSGK